MRKSKDFASKLLMLISLLITLTPELALAVGPSGFTVGYALQEGPSVCSLGSNSPTIQTPMFAPYNRDYLQWWYNIAEEAAFTNVTFIALNFRGDSPCGIVPPPGGEPTSFAGNLVSAINTRGYTGFLKVAMFDDTGSYIWHIRACSGNPNAVFDFSNQGNWQTYFWDNRWLQFFQNVPDANRMKIQNRPLVFLWNVSPAQGFTNLYGNLTSLIQFLRAKCQSTFGFNPFIVVDHTWLDGDPGVGAAVDGVNTWFDTSPNTPWSLYTHNGASGTFTTGVVNPGFWVPASSQYTPRNNGQTLSNGLANTRSANLLLMEGLSDVEENAGYYRGASLCNPSCGSPYNPPPGQCWFYANQYLNTVREAVWAYPMYVDYQAEAADAYQLYTTSGSGLYRRDGALDIAYTDYTQSQWAVRLQANEWLQFNSFQLGGSSHYRLGVMYGSQTGATVALLIDGVQVSSASLASTGGLDIYSYLDIPQSFPIGSGRHNIRFQVLSGDLRVDFWRLNGF
ncbi:MAG TPA: DUF5010 domain-containing protein [Thermoanaerobaculia bacterium]|nr:DUF5010 domain-containing protein [Thermoanaerobaculia bacterium]